VKGGQTGFIALTGLRPEEKEEGVWVWLQIYIIKAGDQNFVWGQSDQEYSVVSVGCRKWTGAARESRVSGGEIGERFWGLSVAGQGGGHSPQCG